MDSNVRKLIESRLEGDDSVMDCISIKPVPLMKKLNLPQKTIEQILGEDEESLNIRLPDMEKRMKGR